MSSLKTKPAGDGDAPAVTRFWRTARAKYDTSPALSPHERKAVSSLGPRLQNWRTAPEPEWAALKRLVDPLRDAFALLHVPHHAATPQDYKAVAYVLHACVRQHSSFWAWDANGWAGVCGSGKHGLRPDAPDWARRASRQHVIALAYILGDFTDPLPADFYTFGIAEKVFGRAVVVAASDRVSNAVSPWGYANHKHDPLRAVTCDALILNRDPDIEHVSIDVLKRLASGRASRPHSAQRNYLYRLRRALEVLDIIPASSCHEGRGATVPDDRNPEWSEWVERWYQNSTAAVRNRRQMRANLFRVGRWLATEHPGVKSPGDWTTRECAAYVAHVDRLRCGDNVATREFLVASKVGQPLVPNSKVRLIATVRQFMRDCQAWQWIPCRFDPSRALRTPRTIVRLTGPDPRIIDDNVWAKLMWAGLNLGADDIPLGTTGARFYPIEMVRALTLTWLFAGLRSDEIARLRLGCIRWQSALDADEAVCLLDVPTTKTGSAFTKPVEPLVGRAIEAWESIRPQQPKLQDRKTGALVDHLFCFRGRKLNTAYVNDALIPVLCAKAGVPVVDARGRITSHRARSTIATQLYNAKDPMTLFELQEWLGHRSPLSTQQYAKITPATVTKAYKDAGYFARNIRVIDVLVDRDAIRTGAASSGEPWQHFDLGHGYCTYDFFERCPHRMACARCEFYVPKESSHAQLLEAKQNLQRMLLRIPLTDDERAAVDGDCKAIDALVERLADVPTPAGPTPRAFGGSRPLRMLPLTEATPHIAPSSSRD